jgi:3-oxoadipate enol-lactonase
MVTKPWPEEAPQDISFSGSDDGASIGEEKMPDLPAVYMAGLKGPPILFLHGVGGDHAAWRPQLLHFAARYRCFAWDMPGYGASPAREMSFPALAGALVDLVDGLGLPKIHLVGQSLGGMIAQEFAVAHPDRLLSLSLIATSPAFGGSDKAWQQKFVDDRVGALERGATMPQLARDNIRRIVGPAAGPAGVEIAVGCTANLPVESYKQAIRMIVGFDRRDALPNIKVPTLALAGAVDTVAPAPMMAKMAARIPGARFIAVPEPLGPFTITFLFITSVQPPGPSINCIASYSPGIL